jgi:uncharacterized protein
LTRAHFKMFALGTLYAGVMYAIILLILYSSQRQLLYLAHTSQTKTPAEYGIKGVDVVDVKTEDGLTLHDWFVPPPKKDGMVIVVFHGSFANLGDIAGLSTWLMESNFGVFMCEYRGFGGGPGEPSEQGLYADGRAAIKWLKEHGYKPEQMVYWGVSLGTGVAVQMAVETPPAFIALQAPYTSVVDVAKERYSIFPIDALIKDRFDSISKIAKIKVPLMIAHGTADTTVPIKFSQALFKKANPPKVFYSIKGAGHDSYMPDVVTLWLGKQTPATHK